VGGSRLCQPLVCLFRTIQLPNPAHHTTTPRHANRSHPLKQQLVATRLAHPTGMSAEASATPAPVTAADAAAAATDASAPALPEASDAASSASEASSSVPVASEPSALELKNIANKAFGDGDLTDAIKLYTHAIAKCREEAAAAAAAAAVAIPAPSPAPAAAAAASSKPKAEDEHVELLSVLLSNRSIANYTAGFYRAAKDDATGSLELRPTWIKAIHRKALAASALGSFAEAAELYRQVGVRGWCGCVACVA
jgi:tetratricopeptide (TPR) repeat protein